MSHTQYELSKMTDQDINCAVAEKLGYKFNRSPEDKHCVINNNKSIRAFNPCSHPNDYMPIAIENNITIDFVSNQVCAMWAKPSVNYGKYAENDYIATEDMNKDKTGRVVCEAFLMLPKTQN